MKRLFCLCLLITFYCQINAANLGNAYLNKRISQQKCEEYGENFKTCTFNEDNSNDKTEPGQYPHMVILFNVDNKNTNISRLICLGTLISENYVLTAGHCVRLNSALWKVRLGAYDLDTSDETHLQDLKVSEIIIHPNYKWPILYYDIALLKLEKPAKFNKFVRPICLSDLNLNNDNKYIISGWGLRPGIQDSKSKETYLLHKKNVKLVSSADCNKTYTPTKEKENGINEDLFCSTGFEENICEIISGAPLQEKNKENPCMFNQIGLLSFGYKACKSDIPLVYAKLVSYIDWIENIVWK